MVGKKLKGKALAVSIMESKSWTISISDFRV